MHHSSTTRSNNGHSQLHIAAVFPASIRWNFCTHTVLVQSQVLHYQTKTHDLVKVYLIYMRAIKNNQTPHLQTSSLWCVMSFLYLARATLLYLMCEGCLETLSGSLHKPGFIYVDAHAWFVTQVTSYNWIRVRWVSTKKSNFNLYEKKKFSEEPGDTRLSAGCNCQVHIWLTSFQRISDHWMVLFAGFCILADKGTYIFTVLKLTRTQLTSKNDRNDVILTHTHVHLGNACCKTGVQRSTSCKLRSVVLSSH